VFSPNPGEIYLSVHWLEYFHPLDSFPTALARLRDFLLSNPAPQVRPQKSGKLAVLQVGSIHRWGRNHFRCRHVPMCTPAFRTGVGQSPKDPKFDPHSAIFAFPWKGPEALAVQQYLLSKVLYSEQGKL
jgi:hypothetical protein